MLGKRWLRIPNQSLTFQALGFAPCEPSVREPLEKILHVFADGYNLALVIESLDILAAALRLRHDVHHVGFAFEGAGMAYAARDLLTPWQPSQLAKFTRGPAPDHDYIVMVGAGFAYARLPWGLRLWPRRAKELDPRSSWCLFDGYGFYQGIFRSRKFLDRQAAPPRRLPDFAKPLFDAGLGRSLWWREGASPDRIAAAISRFAVERRAEMWCGVGIAAAYAGGISERDLERLRKVARFYRTDLLSGVPFAARMRQKGGNRSAWTDLVCARWLGCDCDAAGDLLVSTLDRSLIEQNLAADGRLGEGYSSVRRELVVALTSAI